MKLINPLEITKYGIVVYQQAVNNKNIINLKIFFTKVNPLFNWLTCDNGERLIWDKTISDSTDGTIFIYETRNSLEEGFYRIVVESYSYNGQSKLGEKTIGVLEETDKIIIGLPYSIYDPITLS
jgi:hypothetical protein